MKKILKSSAVLLKLGLLILASYFLYKKIDLDLLLNFEDLPKFSEPPIVLGFVIFGLFNLLIDVEIWKQSHSFIGNISRKKALRSNLISYSLSFVSPANSGEMLGRYISIEDKVQKKKAVYLSFWTSFPKLVARYLIGGIATLYFLSQFYGNNLYFIILAPALVIITLIIYFKLGFIRDWLSLKNMGRFELANYLIADKPSMSQKRKLLGLSSLKFVFYNLQYGFLLFALKGDFIQLLYLVPAYYLISSTLPSIPAVDFIVKSAFAVWLFEGLGYTNEDLLITSAFMWIFNICLPAMVGTYKIMSSPNQKIKSILSP